MLFLGSFACLSGCRYIFYNRVSSPQKVANNFNILPGLRDRMVSAGFPSSRVGFLVAVCSEIKFLTPSCRSIGEVGKRSQRSTKSDRLENDKCT